MLISKARLTYKLDSLKNAFDAATDTCSMYLSMLPDTMAAEASNKYRLGSMGSRTYLRIATDNKQGQPDIYTKSIAVPICRRGMGHASRDT